MQTFSLSDCSGSKQYYDENGYVVFRGLIPDDLSSNFIREYDRAKGDRTFLFPTQSTYDVLPFVPDAYGHIPESVENPAFMALRPRFSRATRACLLSDNMAAGLAAIDGSDRHVFWQSMFFDKSTGTPTHQDSLYLDTEPRGKLIGAWVALEDIDEKSGPFVVYAGSHKTPPFTDNDLPQYGSIYTYCQKAIENQGFEPTEMTVNKGDVIFWHPFLMHGAADNRDPSFSRKSLTAHFYPSQCFTIDSRDKPMRTRPATPSFDFRKRNHLIYHLGAYRRWFRRKLARRPALSSRDMKAKIIKLVRESMSA